MRRKIISIQLDVQFHTKKYWTLGSNIYWSMNKIFIKLEDVSWFQDVIILSQLFNSDAIRKKTNKKQVMDDLKRR